MTAKHILLVDDDAALRPLIAEQLAAAGMRVTEAASMAEGLEKGLHQGPFDAMLLNSDLPDGDGGHLCRHLRAQGITCPILLLTAPGSPAPALAESGATGHIAKPFRLAALLARLRDHLRQGQVTTDQGLDLGPYRFHPGAKQLLAGTQKIRLTEKETQILRHLHGAGGQCVPRDALLDAVWGYADGITTHTLETHIYRLRRKIEPDPAQASLLVTEPGGYRLVV